MIRPAFCLTLALALPAGAFQLSTPVDCAADDGCIIQQYPDHDPTEGATDYRCGPLSYDGHDGTDFAVPSMRVLARGVPVVAAAAGRVIALRDGVAENTPGAAPDFPQGQDCGNGILIDHGGGWQSQYCHMRPGSLVVAKGDTVAAGEPLGLMGLSGQTEFPHLHLTLRRNGKAVDPFAPEGGVNCMLPDAPPPGALWSVPPGYAPGGIVDLGVSDDIVDFQAVRMGPAPVAQIAPDAPMLVVWAHLFGLRSGDELRLTINGPDGVLVDQTQILDRTQARAFRMLGSRIGARGRWPAGDWTAAAIHLRAGAEISRREIRFAVPQ